MKKYLIGSSGDSNWQDCNAKTLTGAKRCALSYYQASVGGKISVAVYGRGDGFGGAEIIPVAVKRGFGKWIDG